MQHLSGFDTIGEPYSIAVDSKGGVLVATTSRRIEIYDESGRLGNHFDIPSAPQILNVAPIYISATCTTSGREILISDSLSKFVSRHSYDGRLVERFQPRHGEEVSGLGFTPAGVAVNTRGRLIVADMLNGVVGQLDETGTVIEHLVGPMEDGVGVHAVALGPEGHLVVAEFTANGRQRVNVYQYRRCQCHPCQR